MAAEYPFRFCQSIQRNIISDCVCSRKYIIIGLPEVIAVYGLVEFYPFKEFQPMAYEAIANIDSTQASKLVDKALKEEDEKVVGTAL